MRAYLSALERTGDLVTVSQPVALLHELAACLGEINDGPAMVFSAPTDMGRAHNMPVVGNLLNSLPRYALALDCEPAAVQSKIIASVANPIAHTLVTEAPCHEVTIRDPSLTDELPIPHFFEREGGAYITAATIVAHDTTTGIRNLSIARIMPLGGNRAFVGIAPNHHLAVMARAAQARGERLHIAACIGTHPAITMAACLYLGLGDDELPIAGALLGEPLEVVRCQSSDLLVPAHCECVLEGTLDADDVFVEGPVSEFHGMYENYGPGIVATFSHLTRRHDAIFQAILPGYHPEHCLLGGVSIAAGLASLLRASMPTVREVAVGLGGAGRLHAVVSLQLTRPGQAKKVMFAVWAAVNLIKQIVVVDEDIDPWDSGRVEWAIATRAVVERDYTIVPGVQADRSEPLDRDGTIGKLGIDATRHPADRADFTIAAPPLAAIESARRILRESGVNVAGPSIV